MSIWDSYKRFNFGPFAAPYRMANSFLHPERGYQKAYDEEQAALDRFRNQLQPYQQAGIGQLPQLQQATGALLDPAKLESDWTNSYQQSPYLKQLLGESKEAGLDAASSMGLMGSSAALGNIQKSATGLGEQFRSQYLDDLMKKYLAGIQTSKGIYDTGANIAGTAGAGELEMGQELARMLFNRQNAPGALFGPLAGTAIGAFAGGPMGAMVGSQVGSRLGPNTGTANTGGGYGF